MPDRPRDDRAVVDAVLAGDTDAFRLLVERDSRLVIGVCARIVRDRAEAEDVAQEAFLKAYQALATFRGDGSFGAWVTRIAVRLAAGRAVSRPHTWSLDDEAGREVRAETLPAEVDLELGAVAADGRRAIWAAVAALPKPQRDVVALRFARDLSVVEIATLTRVSSGTVKSRLHRAMSSLREKLAELDELGSRGTP